MQRRFFLMCSLLSFTGLTVSAQEPKAKAKPHLYAHDLRVRKAGVAEFDKDTAKYGIEFFQDDASGAVVALMQNGTIAAFPFEKPAADKKAVWMAANDLRARKSDEEKFTTATAKIGVETFKDTAVGKLIYVSERGTMCIAPMPAAVSNDKDPVWHHALVLKVRGGSEAKFTDASRKYGVEVYKDGNTGGLIYLSETGAAAAAAAPAVAPENEKIKAPKGLYGMTLPVRKGDQVEFTKDIKPFGVEVYKDDNVGGLVYLSETGSIAVVAAAKEPTTGKGVTHKYAMLLKARPAGKIKFEDAVAYGIEVYIDENTGNTVMISETGSIAVLPAK